MLKLPGLLPFPLPGGENLADGGVVDPPTGLDRFHEIDRFFFMRVVRDGMALLGIRKLDRLNRSEKHLYRSLLKKRRKNMFMFEHIYHKYQSQAYIYIFLS